ncbi:Protein with double-stranded beta-helix domain, Cupin related protein [Deinococcus geothermalis DSM 11300]|uniref:Protein with double-stranded beta-helix domain, Cupin related protein n=1 Tax=Deinococcus geothermalis (strain DSM 11300 / CIP 105573 / AG-3a) TaxID=319795 RepID=Q1IW53_DEIGD|nr:Protein with double-stranded beta-helix domain, Cupin related protein [Deinococcus geothermalis DSM 11300]
MSAGAGLVQREDGPVEAIHPGAPVWFEPSKQHWDDVALTSARTHITVQESQAGRAVNWLEHVSDKQNQGYSGAHLSRIRSGDLRHDAYGPHLTTSQSLSSARRSRPCPLGQVAARPHAL